MADLDSELLQRDAAIDNLQRTLRETQETLQKALPRLVALYSRLMLCERRGFIRLSVDYYGKLF